MAGQLKAHKAFWQYPECTGLDATITEMVYIDNVVPDGLYLLQIQIPALELDASPSRPLYLPAEMRPMYANRSETYEAFLAIDEAAYKEKIQFIEENFFMLRQLEAGEYFDMMVLYGEALFEAGEYARQAKLADHIVEMSIERNIIMHREQDVYFETLFKKAASLHNLDKIDQAVHILKELVKINPDHESTKLFLINCIIHQKKPTVRPYRNVSLVLLLSSAL